MDLPEVRSEGRTGRQMIALLKRRGFHIGGYAMQIILSESFVPTRWRRYQLEARDRQMARQFDSWTPIEAAVLLRERMTDRDLAAVAPVLLVMHQPVICSDGYPYVLGLCRDGGGGRLVGFNTRGSIVGIPQGTHYAYRKK